MHPFHWSLTCHCLRVSALLFIFPLYHVTALHHVNLITVIKVSESDATLQWNKGKLNPLSCRRDDQWDKWEVLKSIKAEISLSGTESADSSVWHVWKRSRYETEPEVCTDRSKNSVRARKPDICLPVCQISWHMGTYIYFNRRRFFLEAGSFTAVWVRSDTAGLQQHEADAEVIQTPVRNCKVISSNMIR